MPETVLRTLHVLINPTQPPFLDEEAEAQGGLVSAGGHPADEQQNETHSCAPAPICSSVPILPTQMAPEHAAWFELVSPSCYSIMTQR